MVLGVENTSSHRYEDDIVSNLEEHRRSRCERKYMIRRQPSGPQKRVRTAQKKFIQIR
jgi:hypothetical protein